MRVHRECTSCHIAALALPGCSQVGRPALRPASWRGSGGAPRHSRWRGRLRCANLSWHGRPADGPSAAPTLAAHAQPSRAAVPPARPVAPSACLGRSDGHRQPLGHPRATIRDRSPDRSQVRPTPRFGPTPVPLCRCHCSRPVDRRAATRRSPLMPRRRRARRPGQPPSRRGT